MTDMRSVRETSSAPVDHFLAIADLDRTAWEGSAHAQFVPDGEHSWRVWCEFAYVDAYLDSAGDTVAFLCAFAADDGTHFLHKVAVREGFRRLGLGDKLMNGYTGHLDERAWSSLMTTSPSNTGMISLSDRHGWVTEQHVAGYYRPDEDRLLRRRFPLTV